MAKRPSIATFSAALRAAEARPHDAETLLAASNDADLLPPPRRRKAAPLEKAAVFVRVTPASLAALHALADAEGITLQDLGVYALNLAMTRYGRAPVVAAPGR